jgi:uncharacterized protein (UPF0248 family)
MTPALAMMPINQLLNRIRWDTEFARGEFELGYFDRVEGRIVVLSFREIDFPQDQPHVFQVVDEDGGIHRVPFHRVREVYKNGQRIWRRLSATG